MSALTHQNIPLMKHTFLLLVFVLVCGFSYGQNDTPEESTFFELRIYTAHEGKLKKLIRRFKKHTVGLFEKSGMENVAYFLPKENSEGKLYYILGYPDRASRDQSWQQFGEDPQWKKVYEASRKKGPLVASIESYFMTLASGLNERPLLASSGIFQLRVYTCFEGRGEALQRRFQAHTQALFEKQGFQNHSYFWTVPEGEEQSKLVYLLGHQNLKLFEDAFEKFRADPEWIKVRDASEEDGKIVQEVEAVVLKALPFSRLK